MMTIFVLLILFITGEITRSEFSDISDVEVDRLLKKLNKPALKSIKSPDGDIIDCVHMKNHPIYDHPLFKNHTIQMKPTSYPKSWNNKFSEAAKKSTVIQLWTINGKCPKNSIPIRRTKREDILRVGSIERYVKKDPNSIPRSKPSYSTNDNTTHEHAVIKVEGSFYGTRAIINVWRPYVQTPLDFSLAQIWVAAGHNAIKSQLNTIEFGFQVYENKYGDNNARYFVYWTKDGYNQTGCYNLDCAGFVVTNQAFALGAAVHAVSTFDGQQEQLPATIWKDPQSGHWWLKVNTHTIVGYWPAGLFTHLKNVATNIEWGGEIADARDTSEHAHSFLAHDTQQKSPMCMVSQHTTTHMGSGHFAQDGWRKASYFKNLEIVDEDHIMRTPTGAAYTYMTRESCYNVIPAGTIDDDWGFYFYYGGPGRNPNCM